MSGEGRPGSGRVSVWTIVALVIHVAVLAFPISATGVLAPPLGVAAAGGLWLAGLLWIYKTARTGALVILGPIGTLALWWALMTVGDVALGWTG